MGRVSGAPASPWKPLYGPLATAAARTLAAEDQDFFQPLLGLGVARVEHQRLLVVGLGGRGVVHRLGGAHVVAADEQANLAVLGSPRPREDG